VVAGMIRSAQTESLARSGDPVVLASMLIGMIEGLAVQVILSSADMSLATMRDICHAFIGEAIARD